MKSDVHKAIFIHVPKAAGTSINSFLRGYGFNQINLHRAADGSNDDRTGAFKMGASRRMMRGLDEWSPYFKFGFVRNPWDRMVSAWKFSKRYLKKDHAYSNDFESFVFGYPFDSYGHGIIWHTFPQSDHVCGDDGNILLDYVGRFEHLVDDMHAICEILDIDFDHSKFPHANKTDHDHYSKYYNKKTRDKVYSDFYRDIELFNYDFD